VISRLYTHIITKGGIVDHNRLKVEYFSQALYAVANGCLKWKGLTYKIAVEQGIATAQLPIGKYLEMATRKVLAINHGMAPLPICPLLTLVVIVFEILLMWKQTNDWEKSFLSGECLFYCSLKSLRFSPNFALQHCSHTTEERCKGKSIPRGQSREFTRYFFLTSEEPEKRE